MSSSRRTPARRRTTALIGLAAGTLILVGALVAILIVRAGAAPAASAGTIAVSSRGPSSVLAASLTESSAPSTPVAATGQRYLLVVDVLPFAGEALASDPIPGAPDSDELVPVIGDPTAFGTPVTDQASTNADASSRCGVIEQAQLEVLAGALNARLPADQQIDPDAAESRSLLHWTAAEGFVSIRLFRQEGGSPSCADAGARF